MRSVRVSAVLGALAALPLLSSSPATTALKASPSARVGAFYFDGWAGPLSNFHFAGLLSGPFTGRRPLNGWRDESTESLRTQLTWARQDGISFFVFDWYYHPGRGNGPINNARDNYVRMKTHHGVGYALAYVNQDGFVIPRAEWAAAADAWVTNDFLNKDYVRIDGRPLLVVLDEAGFTLQMGGSAGVNAAIETLQAAARRHGLPGVYVVGGKYFDWRHLPYHCSPIRCMDTDAAFVQEHWDAITQYGYPLAIEPEDGERQFATFESAVHQFWDDVGRQSPFAFIPSIMPGWDPRPIAAGAGPDESGYPWLFGHLFWTRGSPADVGSSLRQAIDGVRRTRGSCLSQSQRSRSC